MIIDFRSSGVSVMAGDMRALSATEMQKWMNQQYALARNATVSSMPLDALNSLSQFRLREPSVPQGWAEWSAYGTTY